MYLFCFICIEILLEETNFKGFPVVDDMECMRLYGYVRRKELRLALGEGGAFARYNLSPLFAACRYSIIEQTLFKKTFLKRDILCGRECLE